MKSVSTLKEIWWAMRNISQGDFEKMSKAMQKNYDAICNYLEKEMKKI